MANVCRKCDSIINGIEKVPCRGTCGTALHRTCVPGLQRSTLDVIASFSESLFWLCEECAGMFFKWLQKPDAPASPAGTIKLCEVVDKLNSAVTNLTSRIEKHLPCGPGIQVQRPLFSQRYSGDQLTPTPKRSRDNSAKIRVTTTAAVCGTRTMQREIKTVADEKEQFWIYLSRLDPSHTVEDIAVTAQECLGTNEPPKVVLLVKKDADLSKLNFVSFRVEVPNELKDVALQAATWPTGVLVREFDFNQGRTDRFR